MHVRPVERVGVRYRPADPTAELWWSEGVTIYFSNLLLRRAKLPVFEPTRLAYLEHNIAVYLSSPSYSRISAERVSRAAEDPLALGDDYASTHLQGNLLGTMLDLMVGDATHGRRSPTGRAACRSVPARRRWRAHPSARPPSRRVA